MKKYKILFISTPVGALGSGDGGGVEPNLIKTTPILAAMGHSVSIMAPKGSKRFSNKVKLLEIAGDLQASAINSKRIQKTTINPNGVLEAMWSKAFSIQNNFDVIIAKNYDWLAFYLGEYFTIPVLHMVSLSSQINSVDKALKASFYKNPKYFAFVSRAQAATFSIKKLLPFQVLQGGVNLKVFKFSAKPKKRLVFSGRVSPEKGLEDAFLVAKKLNMPLDICGKMQNLGYFKKIVNQNPGVRYKYHGFLEENKLQKILGEATAFLSPHNLVEAFGNSVLEAMACGTPAVAYNIGGPKEIIEQGKSGYLVNPNDINAMANAVNKIKSSNRVLARKRAKEFTFEKFAKTYETWITNALK